MLYCVSIRMKSRSLRSSWLYSIKVVICNSFIKIEVLSEMLLKKLSRLKIMSRWLRLRKSSRDRRKKSSLKPNKIRKRLRIRLICRRKRKIKSFLK